MCFHEFLGWDLEYNKVIRHYHGHLSGVFCINVHPVLDVLVTGGRDSVARVSVCVCGGPFSIAMIVNTITCAGLGHAHQTSDSRVGWTHECGEFVNL